MTETRESDHPSSIAAEVIAHELFLLRMDLCRVLEQIATSLEEIQKTMI